MLQEVGQVPCYLTNHHTRASYQSCIRSISDMCSPHHGLYGLGKTARLSIPLQWHAVARLSSRAVAGKEHMSSVLCADGQDKSRASYEPGRAQLGAYRGFAPHRRPPGCWQRGRVGCRLRRRSSGAQSAMMMQPCTAVAAPLHVSTHVS